MYSLFLATALVAGHAQGQANNQGYPYSRTNPYVFEDCQRTPWDCCGYPNPFNDGRGFSNPFRGVSNPFVFKPDTGTYGGYGTFGGYGPVGNGYGGYGGYGGPGYSTRGSYAPYGTYGSYGSYSSYGNQPPPVRPSAPFVPPPAPPIPPRGLYIYPMGGFGGVPTQPAILMPMNNIPPNAVPIGAILPQSRSIRQLSLRFEQEEISRIGNTGSLPIL